MKEEFDSENRFSDMAMGLLATHFARRPTAAGAQAVTDEELCLYADPDQCNKLSSARIREIQEQLLVDPDLYELWKDLTQDAAMAANSPVSMQDYLARLSNSTTHSADPGDPGIRHSDSTPARPGLAARIQRWWQAGNGWSMLAGAGLSAAMLTLFLPSLSDRDPLLQMPVQQPERADIAFQGETGAALVLQEGLAQALICRTLALQTDIELCVTQTPGEQAWFFSGAVSGIQLLPAPVHIDRLVDINVLAQLVAIEAVRGDDYVMVLAEANVDQSGNLQVTQLAEWSAQGGYFENLRTEGGQLLVNWIKADGSEDMLLLTQP